MKREAGAVPPVKPPYTCASCGHEWADDVIWCPKCRVGYRQAGAKSGADQSVKAGQPHKVGRGASQESIADGPACPAPAAQPEAVVPEVLHFTGRADLEASLDALVSGPPSPRWWMFENNRECADMRARYAALLSAFSDVKVTAHDHLPLRDAAAMRGEDG